MSTLQRFWGRHSNALAVALSFATLAAPFLVAQIPPLTDYPNHLARYWLIAGGVRDPALAPYYGVDWSGAVTNVAADAVVALSAPIAPSQVVGRWALLAAAFLPPLGVWALNLAVFRRLSPWQVLFPIVAWSTTFLMGFINFQLGLGLALLFASLDPLAQPRMGRGAAVLRIPLGLILVIAHPFALLFYATLLAGMAAGPDPLTPWDWRVARRRLVSAGLAAAWCLIPLAGFAAYGHAALPGGLASGPAAHNPIRYSLVPGKLVTLMTAFAGYNPIQELIFVSALAALVLALNRRQALRVHGGLLIAASGLLALSLASPSTAAGTAWIDRRFPIMALLCAFAAVTTRPGVGKRRHAVVSAAAIGLAVAQSAWVAWNWRALSSPLREVEQVVASVPPGAAVLPLEHDPSHADRWRAPTGRFMFASADPMYRHFDSLVVPRQRAFTPKLFAVRGKQPLQVLGKWDRLVEHDGGDLASVHVLDGPARLGEPSYVAGWRKDFDYVLVLNADMPDKSGPFRPPPELSLISSTPFAQLWRVARPGGRVPLSVGYATLSKH
jgi:hypothetical protein